jgi:hypothetical protein
MWDEIIIKIAIACISVLATILIRNIFVAKTIRLTVKEALEQHIAVSHKQTIFSPAEMKSFMTEFIEMHEKNCPALKTISELCAIKAAVAYLVNKSGGDPYKMGLVQ